MVSTIPISGTFSVHNSNEDSKDRLLFSIQVAVKQIQHCCSLRSEGDGLTHDVKEVRQLCESLDKALFHGLKRYEKGYWSVVKELTPKSTKEFIEKLKNVHSDLLRGRAWLTLVLSESSLESYFRSFSENLPILKRHYKPLALLCDEQRMQLIMMLMAGLEFVPISLDSASIQFGIGMSFFADALQFKSPVEVSESDVSQSTLNHEYSSEILVCDNAAEVTCDFKVTPVTSPSDFKSQAKAFGALHESASTESTVAINAPLEEFEMISRLINIDVNDHVKANEDLEVVRTKVMRRTKRPNSQRAECCEPNNSKQYSDESNSSSENRLSKATTDSGLCLETPYSSDNESIDSPSDKASDYDCKQISFLVGDFQQDLSVTFSTPRRKISCTKSTSSKSLNEERGIPEGQEDRANNLCGMPNRQPLITGNDGEDNDDEDEEEISIYDLHKVSLSQSPESLHQTNTPSKTSLSSEQHSVLSSSSHNTKFVDIVLQEIERLGLEEPNTYDIKVGNNIQLYFIVEVFEYEEESFHKIYSGYSSFPDGQYQRVYFLLSNKGVYFLKPGNTHQKFFKCGSIRYSSINCLVVMLNYQGFKIISSQKESYPFYTGDEELTCNVISHVELAMRRFIPSLPLPSVFTDASLDILLLSKFITAQLDSDGHKTQVNLNYIVLARWEDYSSSSVTPSGPVYQDYLMYRHKFVKENKATPWKPAYFILKAGVLYCFEDEKSEKYLFFIQMCAPHCRGCRRVHLLNRPHAFEIIRSNSDSLQLAAADTYEASKWLQCFLETVTLAGHFIDAERFVQKPCYILLANEKIFAAVEDSRTSSLKLLGRASICDVVTVFFDPVIPNYVMLEFEIAEACKSSGEWIICFESSSEKNKFLYILSEQWKRIYHVELSVETVKDLYLLKKYRQVCEELTREKRSLAEFCSDN